MIISLFRQIYTSPVTENLVILLARFALATVFWRSGQTKVDGFTLDFIHGQFNLGWPVIKDTTFFLFQHEYQLPLIPPHLAAYMATLAEHLFPALIVIGLFTRFAALGLFTMTLVIQIFVYPDAYATHATWMAICGLLIIRGAGHISIDFFLFRRH